jgi:hypothetical protein
MGDSSLQLNTTGQGNTAQGDYSLQCNTTGGDNTAVGSRGLYSNTTGRCNTAMGSGSSFSNTIGCYNTAVGAYSLRFNTTGGCNTAVGACSLCSNTTGGFNTALGRNAGCNLTTGTNNTALGHAALASSATASNEFTLGNASVSNLRCNDTTISSLSDERDKDNIQDLDWGVEFIESLRPVKFDWNRRDGTMAGKKDMGFIAQELDVVEDEYQSHEYTRLVHKENPDKWEADPMKTYPILIKAVQELSAKIKTIESDIAALKE